MYEIFPTAVNKNQMKFVTKITRNTNPNEIVNSKRNLNFTPESLITPISTSQEAKPHYCRNT